MAAPEMLRVALAGATGRMGTRIRAACRASTDLVCTAAFASPASASEGRELDGLALETCTESAFDVLLDFSVPDGTTAALANALIARAPLVIGTTGHSAE